MKLKVSKWELWPALSVEPANGDCANSIEATPEEFARWQKAEADYLKAQEEIESKADPL